jgi:hypothetical protein
MAQSISTLHEARRLLAEQLRAWQIAEPARDDVAMVVTLFDHQCGATHRGQRAAARAL